MSIENYKPSKEVEKLVNSKLTTLQTNQTISNLFEITDENDEYYDTMSLFLQIVDAVYLKKNTKFEKTPRFEQNIDALLVSFPLMIDLVSRVRSQLLDERGDNKDNYKQVMYGTYLCLAFLSLGRIRDIFASDNQYILTDVIDDELGLGTQLKEIDSLELDPTSKSVLTEKILTLYNKVRNLESDIEEGFEIDEDDDEDEFASTQNVEHFIDQIDEGLYEDLFGSMSQTIIQSTRIGVVSAPKDFEYGVNEINFIVSVIKNKWLHHQEFSNRCEGFMLGMIPYDTVVDDLMSRTYEMITDLVDVSQQIGYNLDVTAGFVLSVHQIILDRLKHMAFVQKIESEKGYSPCLGNFIDDVIDFYATQNGEHADHNKVLMIGYAGFESLYDAKNDVYNLVVQSDIYYDYLVEYLSAYGAVYLPSETLPILICHTNGFPPLMVRKSEHFEFGKQINQYIHDIRLSRVIVAEFDNVSGDEFGLMISILKVINLILSEEEPEIWLDHDMYQRLLYVYAYCYNITQLAGDENMGIFAYISSVIGTHLSDEELQTYYHTAFNHLYESTDIRGNPGDLNLPKEKDSFAAISNYPYNFN